MIELVVVHNYYAVDCELVLLLVQPCAILWQLLIGGLLPSSGLVAFYVRNGLGVQRAMNCLEVDDVLARQHI